MDHESVSATEIFKALGDPIRWSIIQQVAGTDKLACSLLEDTLPVAKPTISYHTKILAQSGLIEVHKRGRNYFYSLRRDVLRSVVEALGTLDPDLLATTNTQAPELSRPVFKAAAGDDTPRPTTLLTW